jgi:DNA-binding CsgD family transcriptional regulator/PAS domain-containing protein
MTELERLSVLIGDIYDAALAPAIWPVVLRKTADFVGGFSASIFAKDVSRQEGFVAYESGEITLEYRNSYFQNYIRLDPSSTAHFFGEVDQPMSTIDMIPYDEFLQSRFYREWVKPQHLVDFVCAVLDKSLTNAAMFGVFRHERDGLVDEKTRDRMRLVVPHVRRAVLVGRLIDLKTAETGSMLTVLDQLRFGVFLVDAKGEIVHANAAATQILVRKGVIKQIDGRLDASDAAVNRHMRDAFVAAAAGDANIGGASVALAIDDPGQKSLVAHIMPLTAGNRSSLALKFHAVAAVFVRDAEIEMIAPPRLIAEKFKLTPTELRIMLAIVNVGGVPEVAAALGIAESTVKTHLGRLFEKTGATRQADLVKIMASHDFPLSN